MSKCEVIIIGSGPAGIGAALNLRIREKDFKLFGSERLSSKLEAAPTVENYLGFPGITGAALRDMMKNHIAAMNIAITPERVNAVYPMNGHFSVATNKGIYESLAVILASGVSEASELPGEMEFLGRGVGYCATCDAPLYKGKTVVVLGYSHEAADEADFISEIASKVYFLPLGKHKTSFSGNAAIVNGEPAAIKGVLKAETLKLADGKEIEADGFFIIRDAVAPHSLIPGIETDNGHVFTDAGMRTNIKGCFAAGDCTGKPYQYMRAAGQGQVAALSAVQYLNALKASSKTE